MRIMQDPARREMALVLYRTGLNHSEVAKAMDITPLTLIRERQIDPSFDDQIKAVRAQAFTPVVQKAIDLAMEADAEGENYGALKALELVMKFASASLDREARLDILKLKLEALAEAGNQAPTPTPMLTTPEAVEAYMKAKRAEALGITDVEEVIES